MNQKPVYWLTATVGDAHRGRAKLLAKRGFEVQFFTAISELINRFVEHRVAIVVLGDEGTPDEVLRAINKITSRPDMSGVRLILSLSKGNELLVAEACHKGFRDIITLDLEPQRWLQRFLFSTAGRAAEIAAPLPQMTLNNISALALPSRIVWVSDQEIRLETRVTPPPGAKLTLVGHLAEALGLKALTLSVTGSQKTRLRYRFSDAVIARWDVPVGLQSKKNLLMEHLKAEDQGAACKVFVAVQSAVTRQALLNQLQAPRFEVSTALHKHSLTSEPRFFGPDVVFIEDALCMPKDRLQFEEMITTLDPSTVVIVVGSGVKINDLKPLAAGRKIIPLNRIPINLAELVLKKYTASRVPLPGEGAEGALHLSPASAFSIAELHVAARLTAIHPTGVQLALPYPVGNFGLCRVDSPYLRRILNRSAHLKITDSFDDGRHREQTFPFMIDCALVDVMHDERARIARTLVQTMNEQLLGKGSALPTGVALQPGRGSFDSSEGSSASPAIDQGAVLAVSAPLATSAVEIPIADAPPRRSPATAASRPAAVKRTTAKRASNLKELKAVALFFAISAALIYMLVYGLDYLAGSYQHSGSEYSEQLKLFRK